MTRVTAAVVNHKMCSRGAICQFGAIAQQPHFHLLRNASFKARVYMSWFTTTWL